MNKPAFQPRDNLALIAVIVAFLLLAALLPAGSAGAAHGYGFADRAAGPAVGPLQGCGLFGDVNDDGVVDATDVQLIAGAWRATDAGSPADYDFNDNNFVDTQDIVTMAKHLGEPCP